jgi:Ca2+-binding EF-hand superfamily protein
VGGASRANMGGMEKDVSQMHKERFSAINTAKTQIERQREFDATKERLAKEFNSLDRNRDGLVTMDEL